MKLTDPALKYLPKREWWKVNKGMTLLIDPPSGWMYGFPKPYNNPDNKPVEEWLVENGYPQAMIDEGMVKYCWYTETKEDDNESRN